MMRAVDLPGELFLPMNRFDVVKRSNALLPSSME